MKKTSVQSLLFSRHMWTPDAARTWAKMHGYTTRYYLAAAHTEEYFRFRQLTQRNFDANSFRTIAIGKDTGIKAVIGRPKTSRTQNPPHAVLSRSRVPRGVSSIAADNPRPPVRHKNRFLNVPEVLTELGSPLSIELTNGRTLDFGRGWLFCATETGRAIWLVKPDSKRKLTSPIKRHLWIRKAESLFKRFTNFEPSGYSKARLSNPSQKSFRNIGRAKSISYRSDKWTGRAKGYIHTFTRAPSVWSNEDGAKNLVKIMGPKMRLTVRGIEG